MVLFREMQMFEPKRNSQVIPTYNAAEAGFDSSYQLEMTVNASVQNPQKEAKLVSHMKTELGYDSCDIDPRNNTVRIYSVTGLNSAAILKYIKKNIDKNASVQQTSG